MQQLKFGVMAAAVMGAFMQRAGLAVGALAVSLDKTEHGKLPDAVKSLYVEKDGKFALDLPEGYEDAKGLKSALESERKRANNEEKARKELAQKFEGLDADEIRGLLEKMGTDEERKLMKEGKIDEVVAKRMEKVTKAHEKALAAAMLKVEEATQRAGKYEQQVLDNHVRAAATKAGVHATGVEDALFRARTIFKLDGEGNVVQLDADGKPVLGKDGKSNFGPAEWMESMKETAPHWFPAGSTGGGASGDRNKGAGGKKTMLRSAFDGLDVQQKAAAAADMRTGKLVIVDA